MTTLANANHPSDAASVHVLIVRLREAAGQMTPFSEAKLLLREAALTIERLERERTDLAERARLSPEASVGPRALR